MDCLRSAATALMLMAFGSSLGIAQEMSALPDPEGLDSSAMIANAVRAMGDMGGMVGSIGNMEKQAKAAGDARAEACVHTQGVLANAVVAGAERSQGLMENALGDGNRQAAETHYRSVGVGLNATNQHLAAALACVGGTENQEEEVARTATEDSDDGDLASLSDVADVSDFTDFNPTTDFGSN